MIYNSVAGITTAKNGAKHTYRFAPLLVQTSAHSARAKKPPAGGYSVPRLLSQPISPMPRLPNSIAPGAGIWQSVSTWT